MNMNRVSYEHKGGNISFEEDMIEPWKDEKVFTWLFQSIHLIIQQKMLHLYSAMAPVVGTGLAGVIKDQHHSLLPGL